MELDQLRDAPLGRLVHLAGHLAGQRWSQLLTDKYGLTPAGMRVLLELSHGELDHSDVAARCFVRPATLTGIVDTLVRSGHVERVAGVTDRRRVRLALTEKGIQHAAGLAGLIRRRRPLTSVDADPANAAVIRAFLLELIENFSQGVDVGDGGSRGARPRQEVSQA
ncbi:MAG TPA: MarR family transcriptional regulator [Micromonosporaceae bacterium]|jgi:MarR family transcriptional regulator, organic hydroperoxide resistance regulator